MKKIFYLFLAAVIGAATVACNDDDNGGNDDVKVSAVSLDKQTLEMTVGDKEQLTATVTPDNADDKTVAWTSDKTEFVTVDANGLVTAVAAGEATVTATAGGKTATCTVTVTAPAKPKALVKTIKIPGDIDGFYTQIDLTRAEDGKVTAFKKEQHTPQGTQGGAQEAAFTYEAGKVTATYQEWDENYKIEFLLNAEGYVTEAKKFYEGKDDGGSVFAYGSNGMLEKITTTMYGETADTFSATFGGDKNWATVLLDPESGEMSECKASAIKNDTGIDLNMLLLCYVVLSASELDHAIVCRLIPATPNLLESVDGIVFGSEANENGEITSVEMKMGNDALKYSFSY